MANAADTLQRVYDNYARIWLLCTEVAVAPTQAAVDRLTVAAEGAGVLQPKPTYSLDGESVNWLEYQQALGEIMESVRKQIIAAAGPYWVNSTAR